MAYRGSCLCGEIAWQSGELTVLHHCHCSVCRKAHGAPFASWAYAAADEFQWLQGEAGLVEYESSPGFLRNFCGRCGSALPAHDPDGQRVVPLGCLDDDPGIEAVAHVFAASRPKWSAISDGVPAFDELPPGMEGPTPFEPTRPSGPSAAPGAIRGSCLCAKVTWQLSGEPIVARNCHCERCRKARSAAFTSNLVIPASGVRFTSGEDETRTYKVPEARFFSQTFCATCGGAAPRVDPQRGIAIVPMATLDDDPGIALSEHIFVDSKAPWHEITDDLPQYPEGPPG